MAQRNQHVLFSRGHQAKTTGEEKWLEDCSLLLSMPHTLEPSAQYVCLLMATIHALEQVIFIFTIPG